MIVALLKICVRVQNRLYFIVLISADVQCPGNTDNFGFKLNMLNSNWMVVK